MKRILTILMILVMMFAVVSCGETPLEDTTETTTAEETTAPVTPAVNEGTLKTGVYTSSAYYSEMNTTWDFVLTLKDDGTFVLTNGTDEKGAGTYALTDDCYTLTYSDDRVGTFVVQKDGTLKMTSDFPYGIVSIKLELVGDIVFTYDSAIAEETTTAGGNTEVEETTVYTIEAGNYSGIYEKVAPMGTVAYAYTATIGADGTFSYAVSYTMMGTAYEGSSASGIYTVNGNTFTFTDAEGNVTEGKLTANNTLVIALKASDMAKDPYEVTFAPETYTIAAGTYKATYEKVSAMGTVPYVYTATIGADGTFSYAVTFAMGGATHEGSSASGTYTVDGNTFTFTDGEGNVIEGKLTANDTLVIALKASAMAKEPYEVTFALEA